MRREFLTDVAYLSGNAVVSLLFGVGFWILLLKVHGGEANEVGTAIGYVSLAYFLGFWILLGVNIAGQRVVASDPEQARRVLGIGLRVGAASLIVLAIAGALAPGIVLPRHPGVSDWMGLALLVGLTAAAGLDLVTGDLLVGLKLTRIFFEKNLARAVIRFLVAIVIPVSWTYVVALFLVTELGVNAYGAWRLRRASPATSAGPPLSRALWDLRVPTAVGFLSATVGLIPTRVIPYFISLSDAPQGAGYFLGYLAVETAKMIPAAIGAMVVPYVASRQKGVETFAVKLGVLIALPCAVILALLGPIAVKLLPPGYPPDTGLFVAIAAPSIVFYAVSAPLIARIWGEAGYKEVLAYALLQLVAYGAGLALLRGAALPAYALLLDGVSLLSAAFCVALHQRRRSASPAPNAPSLPFWRLGGDFE